jgi:putative ABC transport system permease protein
VKVRRSVRPLRWVAVREVRADVPLLVCLAVLVALLTAVAAAGPGLLDRLAGRALASRLEQEQQVEPGILFSARFEPADSADADAWASDLAEDLLPVTEVIANAAPDALNGGLVHDSTRVELPFLRTVVGAGEAGLGLVYASDAPGRGAYVEGRPPARSGKRVEIAVSTRTRDALKLRLGQKLPLSPGALENVQATAVVVGFFTTDGAGTKSGDAEGAGTKGADATSGDAKAASAEGGDRLWHEVPLLAGPSRFPPRSAAGLDWEARALVAPGTVTALQAQAGAVLTVTWGMRLDLDEGTAARFAGDQGQGELQRLLVRYRLLR